MKTPYRLHYAPDNASLVIRLMLEEMRLAYETFLVDRKAQAQRGAAYLALNPNGLIPVLETPQGPIFETGAILLWLSDTHNAMAPAPDAADRGDYLKWLFFTSNTLHSDLRMLFYPHLYVGSETTAQAALRSMLQHRLRGHLAKLDKVAAQMPDWLNANRPTGLAYYIACLIRWMPLYPIDGDRSWFDLADTQHLGRLLASLQARPAVTAAQTAEGLGRTPFTAPCHATPSEGSAT